MARDLLRAAMEAVKPLLKKCRDDLTTLPAPIATFLAVYNAQGVIDNGGYRYFFEADWPGTPDYSWFADAYRRIGCEAQAEDLIRVVRSFPFPDPHLRVDRRNEFIDRNYDPQTYHVRGWGDALCGDASVWTALEAYVRAHQPYFTKTLL